MTIRGAFVIAVLAELLAILAAWLLRIRGITGLPLLPMVLALLAFHGWVYARFFKSPLSDRRPMPRDAMLAMLAVASIIIVPLGGFQEKGGLDRLVRFLAFVSVVVIAEEVFYRGILQAALERVMHPMAAIVLANVAWILAHAPVMEMNALSISIGASAGMVLGVIYCITRSLAWAIAVHLLNDWALVLPLPTLLSNDAVVIVGAIVAIATAGWWFTVGARHVALPASAN